MSSWKHLSQITFIPLNMNWEMDSSLQGCHGGSHFLEHLNTVNNKQHWSDTVWNESAAFQFIKHNGMPAEEIHMLLAAHLCSAASPTQCHSACCTGFHEQLCGYSLCFSQVPRYKYMVAGCCPCLDWYCCLFLSGVMVLWLLLVVKKFIIQIYIAKIK